MRQPILLLPIALGVLSSAPAFAADAGKVSTPIADLRKQPKDNAPTIIKLAKGREVAILEKSPDGEWARVSGKFERFSDEIAFEGWIDLAELNGGNGRTKAHAKPKSSSDADFADESKDKKSDAGAWDKDAKPDEAAAEKPADAKADDKLTDDGGF